MRPRGIRNYNPGNIRYVEGQAWVGQVGKDDDGFVEFIAPTYGLRAMARLLLTYKYVRKFSTVDEIVARWAPDPPGNVEPYSEAVARHLGVHRSDPIDLEDVLPALMDAIIWQENGEQPYSSIQIYRAITLAYKK